MKIRMKIDIEGAFHGQSGVRRGDVVNVDDENGVRYCALGYAEPVVDRVEERAVPPEPEKRAEVPEVKPRRGRPAKASDAE